MTNSNGKGGRQSNSTSGREETPLAVSGREGGKDARKLASLFALKKSQGKPDADPTIVSLRG